MNPRRRQSLTMPAKRRSRKGAWLALVWLLAPLLLCRGGTALAYRPFDGTDADVSPYHEIEIELGPVGVLQQGSDRTIIAPAGVFNYGFTPGWEFVAEGDSDHPVTGDSRASSLSGNGMFLKHIVRPGVLQDQPGVSVATEFGVLLPGVNAQSGTGFSVAAIVSQQWTPITVHLNINAAETRAGNPDLFVGAIVEGATPWAVRPVAEVYYEHEFGAAETQSLLIGGIWHASPSSDYDVGLRTATVNGEHVTEFRAGVTLNFSTS